MTDRGLSSPAALLASPVMAMLAATFAVAPIAAAEQASSRTPRASGAWNVPRTLDGHPDLQGVWTNATITPLERPEKFGTRRALTDAEALEIEMAEAEYNDAANAPSDLSKPAEATCRSGSGPTCGYNNFWIDRGHRVVTVNGEKRSSLLVDPPNGRLPALTSQRQQQLGARLQRMRSNFDGPEVRPLGERCLLAFGSSSGPPMMPVLYNNHYQIVQSRDTVAILVEMVHDARIVRLNGERLPSNVRKWMGDSVGRWEGDTLVVETTNFTSQEGFRGATQNAKVTERFTRVGPDTIHYTFTVEDPAAFTAPFTGEIPFARTDEAIYEYACHEGNYALPGILAGAREEEKVAAAQAVGQSGSK